MTWTLLSLLLALAVPPERDIALRVADVVETSYAIPDVGARMAARVRERANGGAYDGLTLAALAQAVDRDLRSVANDHHMMLMHSAETLSPDLGKKDSIVDPPADSREAEFTNDGVARIERLSGNVGYVKIDRFYTPDQAYDTLAAAMNAIASTDALIIDLRENIGGHPQTVAFLCSYFFEKRTHLNDIVDRQNRRTTSFWTQPVPGKRYLGKPVYVLVSAHSFSAAEEFAYNMQALKRATIVGRTTAGAANPSIPLRLHDHLVFYLPTGQAVNPVTRTNWEGAGVKPDIDVDADQALPHAHVMALETLLVNAPNDSRTDRRKKALQEARSTMSQRANRQPSK